MCRSSSPGRVKNFHFPISSTTAPGPTQAPIHWVPGPFCPGEKWTGSEDHHSPPSSAEIKNARIEDGFSWPLASSGVGAGLGAARSPVSSNKNKTNSVALSPQANYTE
jgi:hypothetical protein